MERKRSDSNKTEKRLSSDGSSSSEGTPSEESTSTEEYQVKTSFETLGENSRNGETERIKLTFLKSRSSKNNEGTSKQATSKYNKDPKRIHSSKDPSSDELVSTGVYRIKHSNANGTENSQKGEPRNSRKDGIKLTISKVNEQDSCKKKDETNSLRKKSSRIEALKKAACEKGSSNDFASVDPSLVQHDHKYARNIFKKTSRKKRGRKGPRTGSPRVKFSKKAEIPKKTRCYVKNASKSLKSSFPHDGVINDKSQNNLHSRAMGGDNRHKEMPSSTTGLSSKYKTKKGCNETNSSTDTPLGEDFNINVNDIEDDSISKEPPSSVTQLPDVSEPTLLFNFWGRNVKSKQSLGNVQNDVAYPRKCKKNVNSEDMNKEWEKIRAKHLKNNMEKVSDSRIHNAKPGTSFDNERNPSEGQPGTSFQNERNPSEGQPESSLYNQGNIEKQSKKIETLKKQENNIDDNEPEYSIQPTIQFENEMRYKDCSEFKDKLTSNVQETINKDNAKKISEEDMDKNKQLYNKKETNRFKIANAEPGSSLSHKIKQENEQVEDDPCAKSVNDNDLNKGTNKCGVLKEENKDLDRLRIDGVEPGSSFHNRRNNAFKSIKPKRYSEGSMHHNIKDCTKSQDSSSVLNYPKFVSNGSEKKETNKFKVLKEEGKDSSRSRIDISESASSFSNKRNDDFKSVKPKEHSEDNVHHRKNTMKTEVGVSAIKSSKVVSSDGVKKEMQKITSLEEETKDSGRSRINDGESEKSVHYHGNHDFMYIKTNRQSESDMENKMCDEKHPDVAFRPHPPKPLNEEKTMHKDSEKRDSKKKLSLEKQKEPGRSKIDDAEVADKVPAYGGSNENIANQSISPITSKNKGNPKRQSDPLKENRSRPSF